MRFQVTVRKLNVTADGRTDGWTDGEHCYISRSGPPAPREIGAAGDNMRIILALSHIFCQLGDKMTGLFMKKEKK